MSTAHIRAESTDAEETLDRPTPGLPEDAPSIPASTDRPKTEELTSPDDDALEPMPRDLTSPQLTIRAAATGMVIGGALSLCNIYSGLKIGWGFNMSITAALLAFGFWRGTQATIKTRPFGMLENNINQTAASSAAAISSAGLVAPIPALTMITGQTLSWPVLTVWLASVCMVGITVAVGLRRQMILVDKLPFPSGIAAAQTLKEMYAKGDDAVRRVMALIGAAVVAAVVKVVTALKSIPALAFPGSLAARSDGALQTAGLSGMSLKNLGFALDPSVLMVAVGAIVGIRAGISMLAGAIIAWLVLGPYALEQGWASPGTADGSWFGPMLTWLLWPGVALMVTSSLTSFAFSWRSVLAALRPGKGGATEDEGDVRRPVFLTGLGIALVLSVICQVWLFGISAPIAAFGVLLTFALAVVAGRVSGETAVTPVGAMGKVTQLVFGVIAPGNPAANLMSANVTGGAASQCADLLHDMKTGHLLGATARLQAYAQVLGALAGSVVGAAAYLVLLPDPANQLFTEEWPAPAAAAWKGVAEIFMRGLEAMPPYAMEAMLVAGVLGIVLAVAEKVVPASARKYVPSAASLGLGFIIPAYNAISMFLGAVIGLGASRFFKSWSARFLIVIASGLIAGESLAGVGVALQKMLAP